MAHQPIKQLRPLPPQFSPDEGRRIIESRPTPSNIWVPPHKLAPRVSGTGEGSTTGTVQGPASVAELARALQNDPDLIFEWVYNNIDFVPTYGLQKGGYGALIDKCGNSWDQCDLLVQLLTAAGYTATYELGQVTFNTAQLAAWIGTDPTNFWSSYYVFAYGGYPLSWSYDTDYHLVLSHMWVKVNIAGTNYLFDPSYKTYTAISGINIGTATGYNAATFLSDAESGATVTADYVQNMNRTNIRADLTTYANNLVSWIKTNSPQASMDNIVGGRAIVLLTAPVRITSLSYEVSGDTPTAYTSIPNSYKATLQVEAGTINQTFYSSDIHGHRLTLWHSGTTWSLALDGTVVATTTSAVSSVYLYATHPYTSGFANNSSTPPVVSGESILIAQSWGPVGRGMIDLHRGLLDANSYGASVLTTEPIMGENLSVLYATFAAQVSRQSDLINRMAQCWYLEHHSVGLVAYGTSGSYAYGRFDMGNVTDNTMQIYSTSQGFGATTSLSYHNYALEQAAIQQLGGAGVASGVCTHAYIDSAVQSGQVVYGLTSSNYTTYEPGMTFYSTEESYINAYVPSGPVVVPQNAPITLIGFPGYGINCVNSTSGALGIIGVGFGSFGPAPVKKKRRPCNFDSPGSPGGLLFGNKKQKVIDIIIGERLEFIRYYNSELMYQSSELGLGWQHSFDITATVWNDGLKGLGEDLAIHGAAALAEMFVSLDLLNDSTQPVAKLLAANLGASWWIDNLTNNCVAVVTGGGSELFVKLADGSYAAPIGGVNTLLLSAGAYTRTTPQQVKLIFNTSGQASSIVYPEGVTITFSYVSGVLNTVSDNLGRTLTFGYSSGNLISVSDGSRTTGYSVNSSSQMTQYTDANGKNTTYSYDIAGRLYQVFLPANPTVAAETYIYDSLNRIEKVEDALGHQWTFYLSGQRAQLVDPAANSTVFYFNRYGKVLRYIDGLGNETDYQYDGWNRCTQVTLPEGNYFQYQWDNTNNLLNKTAVAKSGSGLANITNVFTYDATWNKVHTYQDGNLNTTTFNWDPSHSTLLSIVRPVVGGMTPQITCTYDSFGRAKTVTDETGIVTQFNWSSTNETLTSAVQDYGTGAHLNLTTQFGYTAWGDVNSVTDPNGNTTTATIDVLDRLTQVVAPTPFSYISNLGYDNNSNLTSAQSQTSDPMNPWQNWGLSYTLNDQLQTVTDPSSDALNIAYDGSDRLQSVTDAENRTDSYAYDALNRFMTETDATSTVDDTRTYTNNGLLASFKDARNNTTQFTYDGFDRLNKVIYPDTTFEQNSSYDANGNVLTYVTRSGNSLVMTYDVLNRLSTKAPTSQPTITYYYDLAGRVTKVNKPLVSGDPSTGDFQFFYDTAGRFYQEEYPDTKTFTHVLDSNGNITKTTWPDSYYVTRVYDQLNRVTDIKLNGASTAAAHYDYDKLSRRTDVVLGNGVTTNYTYELDDDLSTLAHAFVGSSVSFSCASNKVDQLTRWLSSDGSYIWHPSAAGTVSYGTADSVNRYPSVGGSSYSYDGNQNLSGDSTWTYSYDTENHLLSANKTGTSASFVYDPMHRQAQKTVGTAKTRYLYAGWVRLADYDGTAGTLQNRYIYGTGTDEPIIIVSSTGVVSYLHADRLGSIIAQTNSSGAVTNKATYSPFGETSGTPGTTFGFTGQRYDSELGLYYYKNRYYSPTLGRFLQTDPIGYSGGVNLYEYVDNDPQNSIDPFGLSKQYNLSAQESNDLDAYKGPYYSVDPLNGYPPHEPPIDQPFPQCAEDGDDSPTLDSPILIAYNGGGLTSDVPGGPRTITRNSVTMTTKVKPVGYVYRFKSTSGRPYGGSVLPESPKSADVRFRARMREHLRSGKLPNPYTDPKISRAQMAKIRENIVRSPVYNKEAVYSAENKSIQTLKRNFGSVENMKGPPGFHTDGSVTLGILDVVGQIAAYQWYYMFGAGRQQRWEI